MNLLQTLLISYAVKALYLGKDFKGDPPLYMKVAAGLTTGGLAIAIASPTDLVKVAVSDLLEVLIAEVFQSTHTHTDCAVL